MSKIDVDANRHAWVDAARGICIILVVSMHFDEMHFSNLQVPDVVRRFWDYLTSLARPARMPTFFLISGFLASRAVNKDWRDIFQKRFLNLYYIYVIWAFIAVTALWVLFRDYSTTAVIQFIARFAGELVFPRTQLWFIYGLIIFFWIAHAFKSQKTLLFSFAMLASLFSEQIDAEVISQMVRTFPYFLVGVYAPKLITDIVDEIALKQFLAMLLVYTVCLIPIMLDNDLPGVWIPATAVGILIVLGLAKFLAGKSNALEYVGRNTLPIYVMHSIILMAANKYFIHNSDIFEAWIYVYPALGILTVLAICLILYSMLTRFGARWLFELPRR